MNNQTYWDKRYSQGRLWGDNPCPSAVRSFPHFTRLGVKNVLVPGCGYGRNAVYFALQGFDVTAFDLSNVSILHAKALAAEQSVDVPFFQGDLFDIDFLRGKKFDAVYLSYVIHLFLKDQRESLLKRMTEWLKDNGILTFSCISTSDPHNYGFGLEVEPNTFVKHESKPLHFFTGDELKKLLEPDYRILEQKIHTQTENDPSGESEELQLWFVAAEKCTK
ncbi:class I SAM-dependent methyltransferase [Desmospora profundinema]|uniref:2-polyprenyl-3-methyl-5-hydroxy-6-metoxy-1, 4-benzoquinol methylase n=1 Tax=Desmospora profundinema TaxID=1571184 RepID=A0ABU1INH3_9BACL|nr:class I SAM-dependent methyltransferase [Desmospora profundinema]MDR6226339.1 2-polyprenyl-3-methyl-5-hydroxy-6-metoxy-1,4-benzoquinol methylase [Desmospora profundinema]